ncbi:MAG: SCO family protein [Crocinitomicaceae bacterium]|nr:SCO family protein [Crocinitomicaceae bacterium]MDG1776268.1 SCO family protein [Crocinitomicaceae bacterium]
MLKTLKRSNLLIFIGFVLFSCSENKGRVLPILGERDVMYSMVNGKEVSDTIYHKVPAFHYLNQDSVMITSESMKGKVWIADFFFSHCPTICPPMTSEMKRLNLETQDLAEYIQFLSFSIDPERDTPTRLRAYRSIYDIAVSNWHFFTGDEAETHLLAKSFFNGAERDAEAEGGFGHTDYFAIVDKEGYVRGIYQGTNKEQVDLLQADLRKLLTIEYGIIGSK